MTTDFYKIFYDKMSNKPVNVLKLNDNQGFVKSSIIIYLDKNIIENNKFLNDKESNYNIK